MNIFAKFQSQVGKILITAININGPGLAHSDAAARSRHGPDFLCDHDTLNTFISTAGKCSKIHHHPPPTRRAYEVRSKMFIMMHLAWISFFLTGLIKKWLMMPLEYLPLIPAGVRVSEVRAAARSQTSLGQRQLSVLSEFLLSAKIVRNGASSISLARRSARSGLSPVSRPHSVESPPETKFSSHATWKG